MFETLTTVVAGLSATVRDRIARRTTRYDVVLAVIPAAFLVAALAAHLLAVPPETTMLGAAVVGTLALADALFVNPPDGAGR